MRLGIIIFFVMITGCSSVQLKQVDGAKETRVLLLARTNDRFDIIHDGNHIFPRFRPMKLVTASPEWAISDVFYEVAEDKQKESEFTLILAREHPLPKNSDGTIYGGQKELLRSLAKKYDAHYILLLSGSKLYNPDGSIWAESQYGYIHRVTRPWLSLESNGSVFLQASVYLLSPEKLDDYPIAFQNCSYYQSPVFREEIKKVSLPDEIEGDLELSAIDGNELNELNELYSSAKIMFEGAINEYFMNCGLIPNTKKSKNNKFNNDR